MLFAPLQTAMLKPYPHAPPSTHTQVHNLELQKYSLTMHLQKATSDGGMGSHRNPDIF